MRRTLLALAAAALSLAISGCGLFATQIAVGLTDAQIAAITSVEPGHSLAEDGYMPASQHGDIIVFKAVSGTGPKVVVENDLVTDLIGPEVYGQGSNLLIELPVGPWQIFSHLSKGGQAYLLGIMPEAEQAWLGHPNGWHCVSLTMHRYDTSLPPLEISACPGGHS